MCEHVKEHAIIIYFKSLLLVNCLIRVIQCVIYTELDIF